ncbi:MAG: flagellar motor switch protein FliN [Desulfuromonadales bacterium]|nr:flagellar motor switch protein FliN [Desulfuromonadales bacterium]MBN2792307.1 flagellar motor switch protein FliN [Desulfuromonadales bacterium]
MTDANVDTKQPAEAVSAGKNLEGRGLDLLLDIPLEVAVEVGRSRILVRDLLQLQEGSLIELDKLAGEPLDLYVNSRLIARGEAVVVNEKFGLRLTDVVSPSERIENLG